MIAFVCLITVVAVQPFFLSSQGCSVSHFLVFLFVCIKLQIVGAVFFLEGKQQLPSRGKKEKIPLIVNLPTLSHEGGGAGLCDN